MHSRRTIVAMAVLAFALAGLLVACSGGGSDDDSSASDASSESTDQSSDSGSCDDGGDEATGDLPDPCELVPIETATEILGGEAAEPDGTSSDVGTESRSCTWQTQESIDSPSLDNAGHILTLTVILPPSDDMSIEEFFDLADEASPEKGDVCEKSFWTGGMLSALEGGVYLTGSAGLADTSPEGKQATEDLVVAACESL